jgi:hypothetical protein
VRERQGDDASRARPAQGRGARLERRTGRPDVVDQEHVPGNRARAPDPGRVGEPLPAPPTHLTAAVSSPQAPIEWQPGPLRRRDRDLLCRVKAPPAPPPGAGWRGNHPIRRLRRRQGAKHRVGRNAGQREPAAELEAVDYPPGHAFEGRRRDDQVDAARPRLTHVPGRRKLCMAAPAENAFGGPDCAARCTQWRRDQRGDLFDQRWDPAIVQGEAEREARTVPKK